LEAFLPFLDADTVNRALAWSAVRGRSKLVTSILQHPEVRVNGKVNGDTPLYLACQSADRDTIVALLEHGADPCILSCNYGDEFGGMGSRRSSIYGAAKKEPSGYSALHALCTDEPRRYRRDTENHEHLQELFTLLVDAGVEVNQRWESDCTALHAAANNPVLMRLLLRAGADANAVDGSGRTPLHFATSSESISLLVEEGQADVNKIYPYDGRTPLLCMLDRFHSEPIVKLLNYGPDLTIKDKKGNGPLHVALERWSNDTSIIQELLNAGANPNERNRAGETPLLMMRIDNRASAKIIDLLLTSGADINATDSSGKTILSRNMGGQMPPSSSSGSDVTGLIERGADIHMRDFKGRTLLHFGVAQYAGNRGGWYGAGEPPATRFDYMLEQGLDAQALDYQGNTLIHELVTRTGMLDSYSGPQYIPLLNQLISLGIDINQGNRQGRTALHILAATSPSNGTASYKPDHCGPLDFVLSKVKDIDRNDYQGLTALHLASTVSEYTTKKLLDAGSDPTLTSHEGLTPLHLAARARQSNIVGLLLAATEASCHKAMNAEDEKGNTPLYYACRSGRPESVKLFLDAGADASNKTMFMACGAFEQEQKLWDGERYPADTERNQNAGGLTLDDKTRPTLPSISNWRLCEFDDARDSPRLEEIVDLLIAHGCDTADVVGAGGYWGVTGPLNIAANAGHKYAFKCLLRARDCLTNKQDAPSSTETLLEEGEIRAYNDADVAVATDPAHFVHGEANLDLTMRALKRRQFHVIRPLSESGVDFLHETQERSNLTVFAYLGYATLLKEIGVLETERKLGDGRWHAFADPTKPGLYINMMPSEQSNSDTEQPILLLAALERSLPNMEVVRLLVEEFHVDVNQRRLKKTYVDGGYKMMPQETALLYLAKGLHWWHTALAMPYLISKGADIESKDYNGYTSLHIATSIGQYVGPFYKDAAMVLVAAGAEVNTKDNKGQSCLASAIGNDDMFQLLIDHGASIRPDALFMAINAKRADIVERLLKAGADPNMRLEADPAMSGSLHNRRVKSRREEDPPLHEVYPLFAAAKQHSVGFRPRSANEERESSRQAVQMVEALLAAGANPYATFNLKKPEYLVHNDRDSQDEDMQEVKLKERSSTEDFEQATLLHDLLDQNELVHPILTHAKLDASRRDGRGRSILHMACHNYCLTAPIDSLFAASTGFESSMPSFLELLLTRGADPVATDNKGRNILHHIFEKPRRMSKDRDLPTMVQLARDYPSLLNQADAQGNTPLHLAIKHALYQNDVAAAQTLLDAGANASAVDNNGNGCLHLLALRIYESASIRNLFAALIKQGLDINVRNSRGETPIFNLNRPAPDNRARGPSQNEIFDAAEALSFLEKLGADFFARDKLGRGLLHIAAKEMVEVNKDDAHRFRYHEDKEQEPPIARFQVLLAKGLDPMMEDEKKRTCLDVAAACGKESVLELFQKDGPGAKDWAAKGRVQK
jgi:ankyrin repeat protein